MEIICKKIIILGRGESLKKLNELPTDIDTVILVNAFWDHKKGKKGYYHDPLINNFLKNKKIILIVTPAAHTNKIKPFMEKYNIIKSMKTNFSKIVRIGEPDKIFSLLPDKLIKCYLKNKDECKNVGSLGLAVCYSIEILKVSEIHICGLDFYERDYYIPQKHNYEVEMNKSELIKEHWKKFFNRYKKINFNIYTLANFSLKN